MTNNNNKDNIMINNNKHDIHLGDSINDLIVTDITEKSCYLNRSRKSWKTINSIIDSGCALKTKTNPDIEIDWTDKNKVIKFYESFNEWSFYICNGDVNSTTLKLVEVVDNIVLFTGDFYLPSPKGYGNKQVIENGYYYAHLITKSSGFYSHMQRSKVNVFHIYSKVNTKPSIEDIKNLVPNSTELYYYPNDEILSVDYSQSGRNGLTINDISFRNFKKFFKKIYCSERHGYQKEFIIVSDEILDKLMYGNDIDEECIEFELNRILNNSSYHIDDSDSYGDYILNYLKITPQYCTIFFNFINSKLQNLE